MGLLRSVLLKASQSKWLARNLPHMAFSRRAVRRFMPGETLEDALDECQRLAQRGAGSVITRLGENVPDLDAAAEVAQHYQHALIDIERRSLPTHLSVKLTQLGLDISLDHATTHTESIAHQSEYIGAPLWIDMESSAYTDRTIEVFNRLRARQLNVGLCVQAYLQRTASDLTQLLATTTALRLVKGAYQEPAAIALQKKRDVDANYIRCAEQLLLAARERVLGFAPVFATHDVAIIEHIQTRAQALAVPREHFEFHLLYGINTAQQDKLLSEGYRVRVLISYGSAWFAWYMRRLAERPANVWFVVRSLLK